MSIRHFVMVVLLLGMVAVSESGEAATASGTFMPEIIQSGALAVSAMRPPEPGEQGDTVIYDAPQEEPETQNVPGDSTVISNDGGSPQSEEAVAAVPAGVRSTAALKSIQSVLEQFRTYKDSRTIAGLATLFDRKVLSAAGVNQAPEIVVTDGKSLVTVAIELANKVDTPSFSLKGANMKSIRQLTDTKWEIDALPQLDKSDVRLSIILGSERSEVALVAVPAINQAGVALLGLSEAALDELLVKPHAENNPSYDVNSDGKQDYLDDYILVGHWLLKQKSGVKKDAVSQPLPENNGSAK